MRNKTITILFVMLSVAFASGTGDAFAGNWIVGSASIRNDTGQNVYGERLAVFLVSRKNPVSAKNCTAESHRQRQLDCINNRHLDFYKRFQENLQQAGYLIAQTVTSETGNFAFFDVPAGTFFVLVKFPSIDRRLQGCLAGTGDRNTGTDLRRDPRRGESGPAQKSPPMIRIRNHGVS
jgi:hypothetical protein